MCVSVSVCVCVLSVCVCGVCVCVVCVCVCVCGVCVCVCSVLTVVCVHLEGLNAEHKFQPSHHSLSIKCPLSLSIQIQTQKSSLQSSLL